MKAADRARAKDIFSRFQNLNLLFLIQDLRNDKVAIRCWRTFREEGTNTLCPLMHGAPGDINDNVSMQNVYAMLCKYSGVPVKQLIEFVNYWDGPRIGDSSVWNPVVLLDELKADIARSSSVRTELYTLLKEIYDERLADANAVQEVLESQLTCLEGEKTQCL
jgi:hypothetical protein